MNPIITVIVPSNLRYISPEEIIELCEAGLIDLNKAPFINDIMQEPELARPVVFDEWKGSFYLTENSFATQVPGMVEAELSNKVNALMQFYGDKITLLSKADMTKMFKDVLTTCKITGISGVEVTKKLGRLSEDGGLLPSSVQIAPVQNAREKANG